MMVRRMCRRPGVAMSLSVAALGMILAAGPATAEERVLTNPLGMTFVSIPAGTFWMGSPAEEPGHEADEVRHRVTLSRPFYLQTTEVTLDQWRAVMDPEFLVGLEGMTGDRPVTRISWKQCQAFIEKMNARGEGTYRLPTEAEWEYACRAGTTTPYFWGQQIDCDQCMFANSETHGFCRGRFTSKRLAPELPAPVQSFRANAWGLHDLHGNVWEWVADWKGDYPAGPVTDPTGPGKGTYRVRRGGSWFVAGPACRSASRESGLPGSQYRDTGFRLVREVP